MSFVLLTLSYIVVFFHFASSGQLLEKGLVTRLKGDQSSEGIVIMQRTISVALS